jgi:hypothetical protein
MASVLTEARTELRAQLAAIAKTREAMGGTFDKDIATAAAALGRAITSATAELRQQERHEKRMVEEMSPEERRAVAFQFTRELDMDGRGELRAILDELDAEGRVLG